MPKKFIPNGDVDFATMAEGFARSLAESPERFEIAREEADAVVAAVARYRAALQACRHGGRSEIATRAKDDARAEAERILRRVGHIVRSNLRLDAAMKMTLGIQPRKEKPKALPCPQEPPRLRFVRALHEGNGATPVHELSFTSMDHKGARPAGAVRLELFVALVAPEEPVPAHPGARHAAGAWYLRSYTRSPIKLTPPIASVPMRVVYWGRWADSMGNVGPFSATAVAWIEGGCGHYLPGGTGLAFGGRKQALTLQIESPAEAEQPRPQYSIAVLEARYAMLNPAAIEQVRALPSQERAGGAEMRQIEGAERVA